jgi:sodium-dependent dicarboxylate transporter 2/3/5
MFHIYEGFNLVEPYHKMRHQRKYHPADGTKRALKIALIALVTLLL